MVQPEIFRRCVACGASFRSDALFCPQCGASTTAARTDESEARTETIAEGATETADRADAPAADLNQTMPLTTSAVGEESTSQPPKSLPAQTAAAALDRQKHSEFAPGRAERRLRPRVEKLRKNTSIVIDEAAYDPSLRFILITGVLFLLFLILLVLSKWID